jgi:1-aminocyclopropane-1-carboxylate deaminase
MFDNNGSTSLESVSHRLLDEKGLKLFVKRDDLIHAEISGNKWRKLKYNLIEAKKQGVTKVITFGGAYSNHIAATAAACKAFGFQSLGIIRGEELNAQSNATLQKAHANGMALAFISRNEYKNREDEIWLNELAKKHHAHIVPEGGTNNLALKGVGELIKEIDIDFQYIACAVGTGGTLAGISKAILPSQRAIGVASLKGETYLNRCVEELTDRQKIKNWQIVHDYHFGGYAKYDDSLINYINCFKETTAIPLDPIYTGKLMYALHALIKKDFFDPESTIIAVHTGGLQGIAGFNQQYNNPINT